MESGINTWSGKWDKHGGGHTQSGTYTQSGIYTGSGKWDIHGVESGVQSEGKTVGYTLRVGYRRSGKWNTHGGRHKRNEKHTKWYTYIKWKVGYTKWGTQMKWDIHPE